MAGLTQVYFVQNFIRDTAVNYLEKKLGTPVSIGEFRMNGFSGVVLTGVSLKDRRQRTLFSSGSLHLHFDLLPLLRKQLVVYDVTWQDVRADVYRNSQDTTFNYQYILDAFSSPTDTSQSGSSGAYRFEVDSVQLKSFAIEFHDSLGGTLASVRFDTIGFRPSEINPDSMRFALHDLYVDGLQTEIRLRASRLGQPAVDTAGVASALPWLAVGNITLVDSRILFEDGPGGFRTRDTIGSLVVKGLQLDLARQRITTDSLMLAESYSGIGLRPSVDSAGTDTSVSAPASASDSSGYYIRGGWLSISGTRFRLDNTGAPASPYTQAVDFNHLSVDSLNARLQDVVFATDTLSGTVDHISLREKSGFHLKELRTKVWYDPGRLALDDLLLETDHSHLGDTLELMTPSWSTLSDHLNDLALRINLDSSVVDGADARYFVPAYANNPSLRPILGKRVSLDAALRGKLSELNIPRFHFSDQDGNLIRLQGRVLNAGDPDHILADLTLEKVQTGDRPIRSWLAPGQLPSDISLPRRITLSGPLMASRQLVRTDLQMRSTDGNVRLKARLDQYLDSIKARYDVVFNLQNLAAGKLSGDTSLGRVTASGMLRGKGWSPPIMEDTASVEIPRLEYNRYPYQGVSVQGTLSPSAFSVYADSRDTAVNLRLSVRGSLDTQHAYVDGEVSVNRLDLYATHWTTDPLSASMDLGIRLRDINPYHLRGEVDLDSVQVATDSLRIALDSIRLRAQDSLDSQFITLDAPFGHLDAVGHYNYRQIFQDLGGLISRHLAADSANVRDTLETGAPLVGQNPDSMEHQRIDISGTLSWPKSLQPLLPTFSLDQPAEVSVHGNTDSALVSAAWKFPLARYGDFQIDSLAGHLLANTDSLTGLISLSRVQHPQFPLARTTLGLQAARGAIHTDLSILDGAGKPKYQLGLLATRPSLDAWTLHLDPKLLLNTESWTVPGSNDVSVAAGKLRHATLTLTHGPERLSLTTQPDSGAATEANLSFHDFSLSSLTSILSNDTALASGVLNGTASIRDWQGTPAVKADLKIDSLKVMQAPLGTLTVGASNNSRDYAVNLALKGAGNEVTLGGHYRMDAPEPLDFKLGLQPLSLRSLEPLARDYIKDLKGRLRGTLKITGSTSRPSVLGELIFQNATFNPLIINSTLHLYHEKIAFRSDGIHLDNFVLADSANNEAVINGTIRTRDYAHYFFNLNLQATDFEVLGPRQSPDQMFYGPAYIDSKISLLGTPGFPRVHMNLKLEEKSNVTFAIPETQPGIEQREGVVRFVDSTYRVDTLHAEPSGGRAGRVSPKGFQFSGNLELTPEAAIRIIIDQQNGDNLYVKGNATLNTTMDAGGNLLLTGQYQIQQGKYEMSLNQLIKRSFDIQKGSTITWEGEPTHAQVDITAMYLANAPAIDLVSDQLSNASSDMRTRYKQKEPIQVYLIIKGDMMKPDISFRLDMPEDHQNDLDGTVYTRLKQINLIPSELNKQVMGLLVLNSFIPENPMDILSNGSGGGLEQTARQSVSKILSQQLNNLASNLIKGVDLNFDLQSQQDYSSGTAENSTKLNVGVSKHLFNDRLTVSVGNDFALEGNSQQASGIAGNVSIAYALTKDGRYRLTAYRKDDNEEIIQGQVVETGVTFSLVMDYNKFREIFQKVKKEQKLQLRKARKARKGRRRNSK